MRFLLAAVLLCPPQDGPESRPAEIRTRNGSLLVGHVRGLKTVPLKTKYATLEIPLAEIQVLRLGDVEKEERDVVVTKEGSYRGWLELWDHPLEITTGYGVLRIPVKEIKSVNLGREVPRDRKWPAFEKGEEIQEGSPGFQIRTKDAQSFRGVLRRLTYFRLQTRYAELKVPIQDVKSYMPGKTLMTAEGPYEGVLKEPESTLQLQTEFGVLTLPMDSIVSLHQCGRSKGLGDDFETNSLDLWTSYGGTWKTANGKLEITGLNNYNTVLLYNESLPHSYTLEVDVKGALGFGLLWNAQNQTNANALWINQNIAYVLGGGNWWNWQQLAQWTIAVPSGEFCRIRLEVEGTRTTVWIHEKQIGTVETGGQGGKVGLFCYSGQVSFDNFWIR